MSDTMSSPNTGDTVNVQISSKLIVDGKVLLKEGAFKIVVEVDTSNVGGFRDSFVDVWTKRKNGVWRRTGCQSGWALI